MATLMVNSPKRNTRDKKGEPNYRNLSLGLQTPFRLQSNAALNEGRKSTSNMITLKTPFDKGTRSGKGTAPRLETFDDHLSQRNLAV